MMNEDSLQQTIGTLKKAFPGWTVIDSSLSSWISDRDDSEPSGGTALIDLVPPYPNLKHPQRAKSGDRVEVTYSWHNDGSIPQWKIMVTLTAFCGTVVYHEQKPTLVAAIAGINKNLADDLALHQQWVKRLEGFASIPN